MKIRSKRYGPVSFKWQKRVLHLANITTPTKTDYTAIKKLWLAGYSNKDAAIELVAAIDAEKAEG